MDNVVYSIARVLLIVSAFIAGRIVSQYLYDKLMRRTK
jgi:hypothetical protein